MAKCDLCGTITPAMELEQLIDGLRVPGVADVCHGCAQWVTGNRRLMGEYCRLGARLAITICNLVLRSSFSTRQRNIFDVCRLADQMRKPENWLLHSRQYHLLGPMY